MRLRDCFGVTHPPDPYQKVVIISNGDRRVGLVVDQVLGDHQTVIKVDVEAATPTSPTSPARRSWATVSVALILDIAQVVAAGQSQDQRREAS